MVYSVLCALLWSTTGIFIKLSGELPLEQLLSYRFFLAFLFGLLLLPFRPGKVAMPGAPWWRGLELSSLMTAYYLLATAAFSLAPVSLVVLLVASAPVVTFILQLAGGRPWSPNHVAGFLVTFTGIVLYLGFQGGAGNIVFRGSTITGMLCALGAAFVRALYAVLIWRRAEAGRVPAASTLNGQTMLLGALICLPLAIALPAPLEVPHGMTALYLLCLAGVATVLPTLLNTLAASRIDPTLHNIIGLSTPVVAGLWAWLLLGEAQTLRSLAAAALVLAGIAVSLRSRPWRLPSRKRAAG